MLHRKGRRLAANMRVRGNVRLDNRNYSKDLEIQSVLNNAARSLDVISTKIKTNPCTIQSFSWWLIVAIEFALVTFVRVWDTQQRKLQLVNFHAKNYRGRPNKRPRDVSLSLSLSG